MYPMQTMQMGSTKILSLPFLTPLNSAQLMDKEEAANKTNTSNTKTLEESTIIQPLRRSTRIKNKNKNNTNNTEKTSQQSQSPTIKKTGPSLPDSPNLLSPDKEHDEKTIQRDKSRTTNNKHNHKPTR